MIIRTLLAFVIFAGIAAGQNPTVVNSFPNPHGSGYASGLAWHGGELWCGGAFSSTIYRVNADTGAVLGSFLAPTAKVRGLAHDGTSLWVADWGALKIYKLNPLTGAPQGSFVVPFTSGHPNGITFDGTNMIVSDELSNVHWMTTTGSPIKTLALPKSGSSNPRDLALGPAGLYAGYQSTNIVRLHDPTSAAVLGEWPTPTGVTAPHGLTLDDQQQLYVTGAASSQIVVWAFEYHWTDLGQSLSGSLGPPHLDGINALAAGNQVDLVLTNAHPMSLATLVVGLSPLNAPLFGGTLVPYPDILIPYIPTGPTGSVTLSAIIPSPLPPGVPVYVQYWIIDFGGPTAYAASNAVTDTTQ